MRNYQWNPSEGAGETPQVVGTLVASWEWVMPHMRSTMNLSRGTCTHPPIIIYEYILALVTDFYSNFFMGCALGFPRRSFLPYVPLWKWLCSVRSTWSRKWVRTYDPFLVSWIWARAKILGGPWPLLGVNPSRAQPATAWPYICVKNHFLDWQGMHGIPQVVPSPACCN